jgi:hypothetical protein
VVEDLFTIAARPPSCAAHASSISGLGLFSR